MSTTSESTPTVFEVLVIRMDNTFEFYERVGGHAFDHSIEAMEIGGLGSKVCVKPLPEVQVH